ncbi:cutinase family protein [Corynebacterium variabile]|uniref:cutinase family protein n=1 Tax=Corynebacterium variabile TaxID=1727 RepID=UPI0035E3D7CD
MADTYRNLRDDLAEDATVNLRAVEYPARAVPQGADRQAWSEFLASVSEGADAVERLITDTIEECGEDATIVVAGYSQGSHGDAPRTGGAGADRADRGGRPHRGRRQDG